MTEERYNVLGVAVAPLRFDAAVDAILERALARGSGYVCCGTAHGLVEAQSNPVLKRAYNEAWLTTPDGMPLVWLGPQGVERVYGPDLMLAVCDRGRVRGCRHLLFGGREGVANELAAKLKARFPGLQLEAAPTPAIGAAEEIDPQPLITAARETRPHVIWIGLGSPKQELFMAQHWRSVANGLLIAVGAAFDIHSGRVRQAPPWLRGSGFEWLFRFAQEPQRLGWRYLRGNPLFLAHVFAQKTGLRKYEAVGVRQ